MSNLKNTYGFSQSLLDAILSVQENALKGNQSKIDVAKPKDKLTKADFDKLRTMKKEETELEEGGMPGSVIRSKQKYAAMSDQEFTDLHGHKSEEQLRQMAWTHGYGKMNPHYWNRVQKAKAKAAQAVQQQNNSYEPEGEQIDEASLSMKLQRHLLSNTAQKHLDAAHKMHRSARNSGKGFDAHMKKLVTGHIEKAKAAVTKLGDAVGGPKTAAATNDHIDKLHSALNQKPDDGRLPTDTLTTADAHHYNASNGILKMMHKTHKEEIEQIDEEKTQLETNSKATMYKHDNGDYSIVRPDGKVVHYGTKDSATKLWNQIYASGMKEEVELVEAQNLVPLITQLKALLSWLVSSGAIRKFAKEEAEVVGMLELLEYRTKGAVGKKNRPAPSKESGEGHSEKGETKQQENDEDMPDAYARASRDGRHVIPELSDAAQDKQGGTIQSSNGERPVSQKVAQLFHDHLMKMKPTERAEHSAHIFNGKVPNVKTLNHIKTARLMGQMGAEKKIGSDEGVKRGRGRPKKVQ